MGDAYERWTKRWQRVAKERVARTDEVLDAMDAAIRAVWDRLAVRLVRAVRAASPADRRAVLLGVLDRAVDALLRSLADALVAGRRIAAETLARSIPAELLPDLQAKLVASGKIRQHLTESGDITLTLDLSLPDVGDLAGAITQDQIRDAIAHVILPPLDRQTLLRAWSERSGITATRSLRQRLSSRLWTPSAKTAIEVALTDGLARGETVDELVRRIRSAVSAQAWQARRIARTEARRALEQDHLDRTLTALGDMVQGIMIQAVMDDRTRPEHAARHGTIYYRQPDGTYRDLAGRPAPDLPDAPNCRCTYTPVLSMQDT